MHFFVTLFCVSLFKQSLHQHKKHGKTLFNQTMIILQQVVFAENLMLGTITQRLRHCTTIAELRQVRR